MVLFQAASFAFCREADFRVFLVTQEVEWQTAQKASPTGQLSILISPCKESVSPHSPIQALWIRYIQ